jgi:hypothetical protein
MLGMSTLSDLSVTEEDCVYPVEASRRQAPRQQRPRSASIDDPDLSRQTSESSDAQVCINSIFITEQWIKAYMLDFRDR